jgi:DNA-binding HxlR family transcriptional regulator
MAEGGYNQFCPVAMAAEIICTRWTIVLLREFMAGSKRFNELRRGVPRMSPALLSKRLKDLERAGIVTRKRAPGEPGVFDYQLTESGRELAPIIGALGAWGHAWIKTKSALENLDPNLLMWDMRRHIDPRPMPKRRNVIQIIFNDMPATRKNWWLIVDPGEVTDLCSVNPGFDVDLYMSTDVRTMTEIWMGYTPLTRAKSSGRLTITGNKQLETAMKSWLALSTFAAVERRVA